MINAQLIEPEQSKKKLNNKISSQIALFWEIPIQF
jgi:hypothetical protein